MTTQVKGLFYVPYHAESFCKKYNVHKYDNSKRNIQSLEFRMENWKQFVFNKNSRQRYAYGLRTVGYAFTYEHILQYAFVDSDPWFTIQPLQEKGISDKEILNKAKQIVNYRLKHNPITVELLKDNKHLFLDNTLDTSLSGILHSKQLKEFLNTYGYKSFMHSWLANWVNDYVRKVHYDKKWDRSSYSNEEKHLEDNFIENLIGKL